ncbi:MAG: hypothetical protein NC916_00270 [Candidatus Omnitrophica bacterium]|nr:hypothetical protein [Candidatus Omnitrophota bacterium]
MQKYIIAETRGGLCNRIKCLISAMRIAENYSKELILVWPLDNNCGCEFSDLFENKISEISTEEFKKMIKMDNFKESYQVCDTWRFLLLPEEILPFSFSRAYISEKGDNIDFEYDRIPLSIRTDILKYLNQLSPNKYIIEKVGEFCKKFNDDVISVNIRTWETENRSFLFDIRNVYKIMDKKKDERFFVVCDSPQTLKQIKCKYGNRVFSYPRRTPPGDRKSIEGIQDALIELLLLSKNKSLIASHLSTFSEMAWWLGGCKAKVEMFPITLKGRISIIMDWVAMKRKKFLRLKKDD